MAINSLLIDTNAVTALLHGEEDAIAAIGGVEQLYFPFIVLGELYSGFRYGSREKENRKRLSDFLDETDSQILYPNEETLEQYASIYKILRLKGKPIPTNDLWIAAIALQNTMPLFSLDSHFSYVEGLTLVGKSA